MPCLRHTHLLEASKSSVFHHRGPCGIVFIGNSLLGGALPLMIRNPFFI